IQRWRHRALRRVTTLPQCLVLSSKNAPNQLEMARTLIDAGADPNAPLAARLLLEKGAEINRIPGGFDFSGTGLHYAALNGHRKMVEFLVERGADPGIKDEKVGGTAAGWAEYLTSGNQGLSSCELML